MKTMKWILLVAFFALWACQEEQLSQTAISPDSSQSLPRIERLRTIKRVDNTPITRAVSVKDKLWQPEDTIRIKFQNADEYPGMSDKVIQYAAIWLKYANLHFEYVSQEEYADVKIGFDLDTRELAWSTIGTDCKQISQDEVSLNLYGLEEEDESGIKSEVLRGFGHILGLGFEHKNPNDSLLVFINDKVQNYYSLSNEDVIELTQLYHTDQTNYTDYDPTSIMTLEIPKNILTKPTQKYRTDRNYELSHLDTTHIAELYPFPKDPELKDGCTTVIKVHSLYTKIITLLKSDIEIDWGNGEKSLLKAEGNKHSYISVDKYYNSTNTHTIKIFGSDSALLDLSIVCDNVLSLNITGNKHLERPACFQCNLPSLDVSHNTKLKELYCFENNLTELNISNNKELNVLECSKNKISYLNLEQNNKLQYIKVNDNLLDTLDVGNLSELLHLEVTNNNLSSIGLHNNSKLWYLNINSNKFHDIDISENVNLIILEFDNNYISNINLSNNPDLQFLLCKNNRLSNLNISGLELVELDFEANPITYNETKSIFNSINDRNNTSNGRIRFPIYCYRNSLKTCNDPSHNTCDKDDIRRELTKLFETKHWFLADSNNEPLPYRNVRSQFQNLNYFQQLFENSFGRYLYVQ